jgi:hypothetical protein
MPPLKRLRPTPHASAVAPPLSKPSAGKKKSAKDAVPTEEEIPIAPIVVAAAAAGKAAPIPHASAAPPPLSKPSSAGNKSAEDAEPAQEETTAPTIVAAAAAGKAAPIPHASAAPPPLSKPRGDGKTTAEDAAGALPAKPKGSAVKKSLRKTLPAEEETQPKKKKVCPMTFIS